MTENPRAWGEAEFEAVFRAHFEEIYRLLFRIVGSRTEAEDLAQETFLRCYRRADPDALGTPIRAWLYRVATNLAFNARRDRRRLEIRHERAGRIESGVGDPPPDPGEASERLEEAERVRASLRSLPERQARLLLLRHGGLSYREIAEALEVAPGSVGTLLARAEAAFEAAYRSDGRRALPISDEGGSHAG